VPRVTDRTTKWLLKLAPGLYVLSMALPVRLDFSRTMWGAQLAVLSFVGTLMLIPVCIIGFLGNALFIVAAINVAVRLISRGPRPTFRLINRFALPAALAMMASWGWLAALDASRDVHALFSPGGWAWIVSGVTLAAGAWRLRGDAQDRTERGFEVIPLAKRADPPQP
jgi:hypothetical protein